jgi:hypothetical protein
MGLHHGESPFHKTKSNKIWGMSFSMKCPGGTSLAESRNSGKVDCFLTLILVGVQGENLSFNKIFLLRPKIGKSLSPLTLQM